MNDHDLLEKYEPVLRFAKSERFFPMAVEHYLDQCHLLPSGPLGAANLLFYINEPPATLIGKLEGGQYYLRFINEPLYDSDAWVWLGILSAVAMGVGWYFLGWMGVQIAVVLALIAALILFMLASTIRLRIIPAALAVLVFIALEAAPIWFFLRPSEYVSLTVEYLILFPIYLVLLFYLSIRTMKFIFDRIIPEGPGLVMDMLSLATETIARKSYFLYEEILKKDPQPVYYARVVREQDVEGNNWTILQYHFFYAFNDWRLAANGMNHHEGDWEMTSVYLKNDSPYAVLFSQHGAGNIEMWDKVIKAKDKNERDSTHPVVYVALGSHANYSKPEVIRSPSLYNAGLVQRLIYWVDGLIHYLFLLFNPSQKARQIALKEITAKHTNFLAEDAFIYLRDETDHYVVSLPMEIASGDGFRIGYQGENLREPVVKSSSYLKRVMSDRKVTRPSVKEWRRVVLNPEPDWVNYKGLWGVKSALKDESGPPGPKWDRPDKLFNVDPRKRWEKPLEWLKDLELRIHPEPEASDEP
ncbi:MAG TPA: hypothetical protein VMJ90_00630 [Anaerolineales bacterium]|nr:hypothetical protein [Anaerolineales bacterium]